MLKLAVKTFINIIMTTLRYNPKINQYLMDGCGRCSLGGTPHCKVHRWPHELEALRQMLLDSGLTEELKWGMPCYCLNAKNIAMIAAFKEYCALSFFKGALLPDPEGILQKPGQNTQASRIIRFTNIETVLKLEPAIKQFITDAIAVETNGLKVEPKTIDQYPIPEEFNALMNEMPELQLAFSALTPGRQKAYLLYFSQAKQSATRVTRIQRYRDKILLGKGMFD